MSEVPFSKWVIFADVLDTVVHVFAVLDLEECDLVGLNVLQVDGVRLVILSHSL